MTHHWSKSAARRVVLLTLCSLLPIGSPWVASTMASDAGGAHKLRPATFGDCKNQNSGIHNGYECEAEEEPSGGGGGVSSS